jgi:hypothetical protein
MATISKAIRLVTSLFIYWISSFPCEHARGVQHHSAEGSATRAFLRQKTPTGELHDDLRAAINAAMGTGRMFDARRLARIRGKLWSMWQSLAKNEHDRVDRRSLRYAVHRYLLDTYSISIIGLEPLHANSSHEEVQLLTKYIQHM